MNPEAVSPARAKVMAAVAVLILALGALFAANINWAKPASAAGTCPSKITNSSSSDQSIRVKQNSVTTSYVTLQPGQSTPYTLPVVNYCYAYTAATKGTTTLWYIVPGTTPDYAFLSGQWVDLRNAGRAYSSVAMTVKL